MNITNMYDILKDTRMSFHSLVKLREILSHLQQQYPSEAKYFHWNKLKELLSSSEVLMKYKLTPEKVESIAKCGSVFHDNKLLDDPEPDPAIYQKISLNLDTLLFKMGQYSTFKLEKPVNSNREPIPWITYPALEFLLQFDYFGSSVFEYGSGNSTLFWSGKAKDVISVETDKDWFEFISRSKPDNASIYLHDNIDDFINLILKFDRLFDVIIIDSIKYRYAVIDNALIKLKPGGIIIFDNSDWYPNSCQRLRDHGFNQIDFHGFGPVNGYTWTTSLFFQNNISLQRLNSELRPVGGQIVHTDDDMPRDNK